MQHIWQKVKKKHTMNRYFREELQNIWINYALYKDPHSCDISNHVGQTMKIIFHATGDYKYPNQLPLICLNQWTCDTICMTNKQKHNMCNALLIQHDIKKITIFKNRNDTNTLQLFVTLDKSIGNFVVAMELHQVTYIETYVTRTCVAFMHEQQCGWTANNNIERYFADEYLQSLVMQY